MAVVVAVIYRIRNRHKTAPANVSKTKAIYKKSFKEEFTMEKETKVIKEKVNTETSAAKIERVAAAKVHEEIGEELSPLKSQLSSIQSALNNLESSGQQNMNSSVGQNQQQPNQLLQQMQDFSSQAQQQQHKTFQQLQQTIHQTAQMLGNVEQSLQSINMLNQITQQMNQTQQQFQQQQQGQQGNCQFGQQGSGPTAKSTKQLPIILFLFKGDFVGL